MAVPLDMARWLRQGGLRSYWRRQSSGAAQSLLLTAAMRRPICDAEGQVWVGSASSADRTADVAHSSGADQRGGIVFYRFGE